MKPLAVKILVEILRADPIILTRALTLLAAQVLSMEISKPSAVV
jgi:hypothetical protein